MTIKTADGKPCEGLDQGPFEPIAVIGLAALMPDAPSIDAFWQNIIDSKVSIRDIQEGRWPGPISHFYRKGGPGESQEGFTYSKIGALVEGFEFDWRRWRQPPGTLPQIDPCQLWAVAVAAVLTGQVPAAANSIIAVASGGNIDRDMFKRALDEEPYF